MKRVPSRLSRVSPLSGAALLAVVVSGVALPAACGGDKPPPKSPDDVASAAADGGVASDGAAGVEGGASVCTGPGLDLVNVLVQSACEVPNPAPDTNKPDMTALLDVKASVSPGQVGPGGHADVFITYTNKSKAPLALNFLLDPTPRFSLEVYTATNKRAEMPRSKPPHGKDDQGEPSAPGTARVTLTPGGKATARLDFNAVRLKWAPELVKGTPPELGYPTSPAGPLPKGTYTLKVITPLVGVFEGSEREVSTAMTKVVVQ